MNANYVYGIIFLFLTSCLSPVDRVIPSLLHADSLIEVGCADSALSILEGMNFAELSTIQSRAKYALLLTQAKDKNYITHTDDSLIRVAVDYYDTSDDITLQAKAHYYLGRVCQDRGDIEGTVREFLVAMPLAEKAENYDLNILLKSNLGLLFWQHGLKEEADSLYRQTIELAEDHQDSLHLAVSLVNRADICMERGAKYYADAEKYLRQALVLIKKKDDRHVKSSVFNSLSYLLEYQGKPCEAILLANKGLDLLGDSSDKEGYYLIIGSAYTQLECYDSATIYLEHCLLSDNYYTKASAYLKLSEIETALNRKDDALRHEIQYDIYKDSISLLEQPVEVIVSLKNMIYRQSKERYESFLVQYRLCLFLTVMLLGLTVYFFWRKYRKRDSEMAILVEKRQKLYNNVELLKDELAKKETEVRFLEESCRCLESEDQKRQIDEYLRELMQCQYQIQEKLKHQIMERDEEVRLLRNANLKYVLSHIAIYKALLKLCEYNKQNPDKILKVTSEEWGVLLHEIDVLSLGFVERLRCKYIYLLEEDIHFCCLVRLDFKYSDIAYIWGCTPVAVHKRSHVILERMKLESNTIMKLRDILSQV